jgi:hypothetical protein
MADDVTLPGIGDAVETQQNADGSHRQVVAVAETPVDQNLMLEILAALSQTVDPVAGRMRVLIDPIGGAQTLGTVTTVTGVTTVSTVTTVTTVSTVTNLAQVGGVQANSQIFDAMQAAWAVSLRGRIT